MAMKKHKPVRPGEILELEFLGPMGISKYRLAKETGMSAGRVARLVGGTRAGRRITADTALRLGRFFGTTPAFWMNLCRLSMTCERPRRKRGGRSSGG